MIRYKGSHAKLGVCADWQHPGQAVSFLPAPCHGPTVAFSEAFRHVLVIIVVGLLVLERFYIQHLT